MSSSRPSAALLLRPRPIAAFLLGISSGFPLTLLLATASFWLARVGIDKKTIGFAVALTTPYTLKWLWAPLIDGINLPLLGPLIGQRRAWLLVVQALLVVAVAAMGASDPALGVGRFAVCAIIVSFLSATQDIIIDAYRIEILPADELAAGTATNQVGYRVGNLLAGAGTIWLASNEGAGLGWATAYALTGLLVLPGALATIWGGPGKHTAADEGGTQGASGERLAAFFRHNVVEPFADFLKRRGAWLILLFVLFYKLGDAVGQNMLSPMVVDHGYTDTDYIAINKLVGFWALVLGSLVATSVMNRFGIIRALFGAGIIMSGANLLFAVVAAHGREPLLLALAVGTENLFAAISLTVFATYLSGLSSTRFTATQYALLSSVAAIMRTYAVAPAGFVAAWLGWPGFYVFAAALALPGLGFLALMVRTHAIGARPKQTDEESRPAEARG